ncbi:MAG: hypothetical protein ACLGGX_00185 [Bdellovibrionia bacterium]
MEPDSRKLAKYPKYGHMTPEKIDYIFPFVVFFYGFLVVVVLESPALARLGQERMSDAFQQLNKHKKLAWICFFVGGLWSLQNIWLS